jgi:hypothetical protein
MRVPSQRIAMLENYQTWYKQAVDTNAPEYVGGFGKFRHYSDPFTPANHDVVTPNNDTPYSWAWLDLRAEPWVLSVPAVPKDRYLHKPAPPPAPAVSYPPYDKTKALTDEFIGYLNFLLQFAEPPHPSELAIRKRFEKIGIGPGRSWDASKVDPALLSDIDAGIADAKEVLKAKLATTSSSNRLFGPRSLLKTDYLTRDVAAAKGLYGNDLEEAWYGGYDGVGNKPSIVRFAPGKLPPARFFWSMTLYTLPDRFLYANEINRYSIGDRTKGLQYANDGSLTLYVGHVSPGQDKDSNWLPAPEGPYVIVARVYGPKAELVDGRWALPPLVPP